MPVEIISQIASHCFGKRMYQYGDSWFIGMPTEKITRYVTSYLGPWITFKKNEKNENQACIRLKDEKNRLMYKPLDDLINDVHKIVEAK